MLSGESDGFRREALRVEGCPRAEPSRSHKHPLTMRQEQGSKDFRRCSRRRRRLLVSDAAVAIQVKSNLLADSVVAAWSLRPLPPTEMKTGQLVNAVGQDSRRRFSRQELSCWRTSIQFRL
jgi:hypothetical protein